MARNLLWISLSALLALGLALAVGAGGVPDLDGDGVPNEFDNCREFPNGPLAAPTGCDGQEDGDLDGYGNACDFDVDQDGAAGLPDLSMMIDNMAIISTNPTYDMNCDGAVGLDDGAMMLDNTRLITAPGPSGLDCANLNGTPCF